MCCPLDRACDKLREEAHKRREVDEAVRWLQRATVNVNGIREGLKDVKANAHGQDDFQRRYVHRHACCGPRIDPAIDEEVAVLEITQQAKIDHQRYCKPLFSGAFFLRTLDLQTDEVIHHRGEGD